MTVEVRVRISPRMFIEDVTVLRTWMEQRHPAEWTERRDSGDRHGLAAVDLVLTAVFGGIGEAAAKALIDSISDKIRQLAERYPATEPPPATVEAAGMAEVASTTATATATGDETPSPTADVESGGHDRDAN